MSSCEPTERRGWLPHVQHWSVYTYDCNMSNMSADQLTITIDWVSIACYISDSKDLCIAVFAVFFGLQTFKKSYC